MSLRKIGILIILLNTVSSTYAAETYHWMETLHVPDRPTFPEEIKGEKVPDHKKEAPDFRQEGDDAWLAHKREWWLEEERPYRISPFWKQINVWKTTKTSGMFHYIQEDPYYLGCYCTTVYKRLTLLAGCAVITTRHILTTATSTEVILRKHGHRKSLENLLGAWYDITANIYNSSMYMTPSRIHYHPKYMFPHEVNISHPMPFVFDLAVWASTKTFYTTLLAPVSPTTIICARGATGYDVTSTTPRLNELAHIVGYQFVKAQRKIPMPWMKYVVRTRNHYIRQCPKIDWGWFHCIKGSNVWSKYGLDSGAAWHRQVEGKRYVYDGLIGMCSFTMHLRSDEPAHYFTVLNTHPVMNFFYDAYMGYMPYQYLDDRFYDSKGRAPVRKDAWWGSIIASFFTNEAYSEQTLNKYDLPWY